MATDPNQRPPDYGTTSDLPTVAEAFPDQQQQDANPASHPVANAISASVPAAFGSAGPAMGALWQTVTREPSTGSFSDYLFNNTAYGRVMKAFGQGSVDDFNNAAGLILGKDQQDDLKTHGVWNDYSASKSNLLKTVNELWMRPALLAGNLVDPVRQTEAALTGVGGLAAGTEQAFHQLGKETGLTEEGDTAAAMTEWATNTGIPELQAMEALHTTHQVVDQARANAVIGETSGTYFGTRAPTEAQEQARAQATGNLPEAKASPSKPAVDDVARSIAPDLFETWDKYQKEKQDLSDKLSDILKTEGTRTNSEAYKSLSTAYNRVSLNIANMSTDIKAAYELANQVTSVPGTASTPDGDIQAREAAKASAAYQPSSGFIRSDVAKKLVAAGQDRQVANATGAIVQALMETRAARWEGKLGTADELYKTDFPEIVSGGSAEGGLNQYGGQQARGMVLKDSELRDNFGVAKSMDGMGMNPDQIHLATGWFKGLDGQWRFEIPDQEAALKPEWGSLQEFKGTQKPEGGWVPEEETTLGKIFKHDKLFEQYPEAEDIRIRKEKDLFDPTGRTLGSFSQRHNLLRISPTAPNPESVILHEIQHWIQHQEGFAQGSNTTDVLNLITPEMKEQLYPQIREQLADKLNNLPRKQEILEHLWKDFDFGEAVSAYKDTQKASEALKEFDAQLILDHNLDPTDFGYRPKTETERQLLNTRIKFQEAFQKAYQNEVKIERNLRAKFFQKDMFRDLDPTESSVYSKLTWALKSDKENAYTLIEEELEDSKRSEGQLAGAIDSIDRRHENPDAANTMFMAYLDEETAHKLYMNVAGEVEARDVQARQTFDDTERKLSRPYVSQNVNPEDLIFTYDRPQVAKSFNQRDQVKKEILGNINFAENVIHLFQNADASTAVHEIGHYMLDRLLRDAQHPLAPDAIKADAKVINDWLKGTKQGKYGSAFEARHEKFARAWERYLYEGKAPTQALQQVFARFKRWMKEIYEKVSSISPKIPDDVKQVFDRLLSDTDHPYDIPTDDKTQQPQSAEGSPVQPQATDTSPFKAPETSGTAPEQGQPPARPQEGTKPDTPEGTVFQQSRFLTEKGKVHVDRISSDADLNQYIKDFYDANQGFTKERRGKLSDQDMIGMAQDVAQSPYKLKANLNKLRTLYVDDKIPVAVRAEALRVAIKDSSNKLRELSRGGKAAAEEFADMSIRLQALMATFEGIRSDWGRLGHLLGREAGEGGPTISEDEKLTTLLQQKLGKSTDDVLTQMDRVSSLDTDQKAARLQKKFMSDSSFGDMALEIYRNALISGPVTHMIYALGNKMFAIWKAGPESLGEAMVGSVQNWRGAYKLPEGYNGDPMLLKPSYWEPVIGLYSVMFKQIDGLKAGWEEFKAGAPQSLYQGDELAANFTSRPESKAVPNLFNLGTGPSLALGKIPFIRAPFRQNLGGFVKVPKDFHVLPLGSALRASGERMVGPIHTMDRAVGFMVRQEQLLWRKVINEGNAPFTEKFDNRLEELRQDIPDEIVAQAKQEATSQALLGKPGEWTRNLSKFMNTPFYAPVLGRVRPLAFIAPFVTLPMNVNRLAFVERTPVGFFWTQTREAVGGAYGPAAQTTAIAKMGVTSAIFGALAGFALTDVLTGKQNSQSRQHATVQQMHSGLPYSIRIGDFTYQYERLGVLGQVMATFKDFYDAGFGHATWDLIAGTAELNPDRMEAGVKEEAMATLSLFSAMMSRLEDEGALSGVSDMFKAVTDEGQYGESWAKNFVTSMIPYSIGLTQITHLTDPYVRSAKTWTEAVEARIPGLSERLEPRVDLFGNPVPNKGLWGTYYEQVNNDPVLKAFENTGYFPAPVKRDIMGVKLSEGEYYEYATKAGLLAHQLATQFVTMPGWDGIPPGLKHDMLKQAFTEAREIAAMQVMAEPDNAHIMQDAVQKKADIVNGGTSPQ